MRASAPTGSGSGFRESATTGNNDVGWPRAGRQTMSRTDDKAKSDTLGDIRRTEFWQASYLPWLVMLGIVTPPMPPAPLVGRDAERAALFELLRALAAGRGGAAWVEGEPGIGKSSLLEAVLGGVGAFGGVVGWGAARRRGQRRPPPTLK